MTTKNIWYSVIVIILILITGVFAWQTMSTPNDYNNIDITSNSATDLEPISVSAISVDEEDFSASAISAGYRTITWKVGGYPANAGVDINLLMRISSSPSSYEFIRKIAVNAPNNGSYVFSLNKSEMNKNLFVEVTCSSTYKYPQNCSTTGEPTPVK